MRIKLISVAKVNKLIEKNKYLAENLSLEANCTHFAQCSLQRRRTVNGTEYLVQEK